MEEGAYKTMAENERVHWWFCGRRKILMSVLNKLTKNKFERALDIGCGTGGSMLDISRFAKIVEGVEPSTQAIFFAKKNYPGLKIVQAVFPNEIPDDKYDLITMFDVLEHIKSDENAVNAVSKLLLPGGMAIITVPAFQFLWSQHDEHLHHFRRYTILSMKNLISTNKNISIEYICYYNSLLFLPILLSRLYHKIMKFRSCGDDEKVPKKFVNKILQSIFSLERFWLPYRSLPFGVSILCIVKKINK